MLLVNAYVFGMLEAVNALAVVLANCSVPAGKLSGDWYVVAPMSVIDRP